jgi:hypothetical protein
VGKALSLTPDVCQRFFDYGEERPSVREQTGPIVLNCSTLNDKNKKVSGALIKKVMVKINFVFWNHP